VFDTTRLRNPQLSLEREGTENSVLTVNADYVENGRVGVLIDSTRAIAPGKAGQLLSITFDVPENASVGNTAVRLTDDLARRSVSDSFATHLSAKYLDGSVNISDTATILGDLTGIVRSSGGLGLRNALVTLTDMNGETRTATTGSFGNYRFSSVIVGRQYNLSVTSKRYRFADMTINFSNRIGDIDFMALE